MARELQCISFHFSHPAEKVLVLWRRIEILREQLQNSHFTEGVSELFFFLVAVWLGRIESVPAVICIKLVLTSVNESDNHILSPKTTNEANS